MSKWISVKDRLPEINEEVLCCVVRKNLLGNEKYLWLWSLYEDGSWGDQEFNIEEDEIVTHWMPLPNPPEEL